MRPEKRRPSTPGEILRELYLVPRGVTITGFAAATGLTRKHIGNIVHGRSAISTETAVKFARVLGTTPELWVNLQRAVDLFDAEKKLGSWTPAATFTHEEPAAG